MILDLPENSIQKIILNDKKEYERLLKYKEENTYLKNTTIELKEKQVDATVW